MERELTPRKRTLTEADLIILQDIIKAHHSCRFESVTSEEMGFLRDLVAILKETRSEFIRWVIKGVLAVTGALILAGIYFKIGGKN